MGDPEREVLVTALVEAAGRARLPPAVEARYDRLRAREADALLTPKEAEELEGLAELAVALGQLRSLARRVADLTAMG